MRQNHDRGHAAARRRLRRPQGMDGRRRRLDAHRQAGRHPQCLPQRRGCPAGRRRPEAGRADPAAGDRHPGVAGHRHDRGFRPALRGRHRHRLGDRRAGSAAREGAHLRQQFLFAGGASGQSRGHRQDPPPRPGPSCSHPQVDCRRAGAVRSGSHLRRRIGRRSRFCAGDSAGAGSRPALRADRRPTGQTDRLRHAAGQDRFRRPRQPRFDLRHLRGLHQTRVIADDGPGRGAAGRPGGDGRGPPAPQDGTGRVRARPRLRRRGDSA